jgi:DNA polymerase-3 subunit beta
MEFTIKRSEFFKGLQSAQGVADTKGAIPILSHILIEAISKDPSGIWIYATDLNVGIKGFYKASVKSGGRFTVNARKLFDIVRELSEEDVHISEVQGLQYQDAGEQPGLHREAQAEGLWLNLVCGNYNTRLSGLPFDEFPPFPSYGDDYLIKFDPLQLSDMVKKTIFSVSADETRYTLNGTLLEAEDDTIKMVSTDGHRLSYIKRKNQRKVDKKLSVIIPRKTTAELLKLAETWSEQGKPDDEAVFFSMYENHMVFRKGNFVLVSRVIDGQFPGYDTVIPSNNDKRIIVNRELFIRALKRVSLLSDEKSKMVKCKIGKDMELISDTAGIGEAKERIDIKYDGEEVIIGLNAKYLIDVLTAADSDEIFFDIKDPSSPTLFKPSNDDDYKCVIMPMRLQ